MCFVLGFPSPSQYVADSAEQNARRQQEDEYRDPSGVAERYAVEDVWMYLPWVPAFSTDLGGEHSRTS